MEAVEFGTFANNGMIEIPVEYRKDYSTDIRVILIKNIASQENRGSVASAETMQGRGSPPDIQERIAAAERLVGIASKEAMTLEDIRNERLARQ